MFCDVGIYIVYETQLEAHLQSHCFSLFCLVWSHVHGITTSGMCVALLSKHAVGSCIASAQHLADAFDFDAFLCVVAVPAVLQSCNGTCALHQRPALSTLCRDMFLQQHQHVQDCEASLDGCMVTQNRQASILQKRSTTVRLLQSSGKNVVQPKPELYR